MKSENEIKSVLSKSLKEYRNKLGLNGEEIAESLGINASTYRSWESGRAMPKYSAISELAKIYNVSVDTLLGNNVEKTKTTNNILKSDNNYNNNIYSDNYITELSNSEKLIIMKYRRLNSEDTKKLSQFIEELLPD